MHAGTVFKATQVDGVYTADPKKDPNAERIDVVSHQEAIRELSGVSTSCVIGAVAGI